MRWFVCVSWNGDYIITPHAKLIEPSSFPCPGAGPDVPCESPDEEAATQKEGPLRGIAEIRSFFRTDERPIYFISATTFNLLGIDRWVRNFKFLNYYDSFEGFHPNVFVPTERARASSLPSKRSATTSWGTRKSSTS